MGVGWGGGWWGNQSLLLGVFITKINVSSGNKIDDTLLSLSVFQEAHGATAALRSLHTGGVVNL